MREHKEDTSRQKRQKKPKSTWLSEQSGLSESPQ